MRTFSFPGFGDTNLLHLNGNLLCAIDLKTTGIDPNRDSIIEICILPVNAEFRPHKKILPFNTFMKPNIDAVDLEEFRRRERVRIVESALKGMDPYIAADRFDEWYGKIGLPPHKKIFVLSYDWTLKQQFISKWLGPVNYDSCFSNYYRDVIVAAQYSNDRADLLGEKAPYPKLHLQYLISQTKSEGNSKQDSLWRCITILDIYKRMLKHVW